MTAAWLDAIEAAADRGGRCTVGVVAFDCSCDVCAYRQQCRTLDKEQP